MKKLTALATILALTAACSGNPVPEDHFYRLPAPAAAEGVTGLSSGTVFVEQFIADGVHRERAIVYAKRAASTELLQYHYHYWMDSPTRLVRDHLADYLRAGGAAGLVSTSPDVLAELSIFGRIRQFEIIEGAGAGEAIVSLEFRVDREGKDAPILIKSYEERTAADDDSVNGAVAAFGTALGRIYARLAEDIRAGL
jgi:ABC-type uncharacterized transport system auxiliary subunit